MRIGAGFNPPSENPDEWIGRIRDLDVSAVVSPVSWTDSAEVKKTYLHAVRRYDLVIGEVGVWKNPLSPDEAERREAIAYSQQRLALADELGAGCCVNITGARGPVWDGYYPENYTSDTYALIVDTIRSIIDAVKPRHTFYTVESMPWMVPDSPDGYLQLLRDVDRRAMGVHLDYANMISSVERYRDSAAFISECFHKLGPHIKSIHAKDVLMDHSLPCCIREVAPGEGIIDFGHVASQATMLGEDTPVFVEHLRDYEEYKKAIAHLRRAAAGRGIAIKSMISC